MIFRIIKFAAGLVASYIAYRRAKDGNFSALQLGKAQAKSAMDNAAAAARETKEGLVGEAKELAKKAKGVCKEV